MTHKQRTKNRAYAEELVSLLWMLEPDRLERLGIDIHNAPDEGMADLCDVLERAVKQQDDFLKKIIKADPRFPAELGTFLREKFLALRGESDREDKNILQSIDSEIDQ